MGAGIPNSQATFGSPILWITLGHGRNTQGCQNAGHEEAQIHPQQRTERAAWNLWRAQDGVFGALRRDGRNVADDLAHVLPADVPQAREISEIACACCAEGQWPEVKI
jgi:hypothetical protein